MKLMKVMLEEPLSHGQFYDRRESAAVTVNIREKKPR